LVPALQRRLTVAVGLEEGLQPRERVGELVAEEHSLRIVLAGRDRIARRAGVLHHEVRVEAIADRLHRVMERHVLPEAILPVALRHELRDAEPAQDRALPAVPADRELLDVPRPAPELPPVDDIGTLLLVLAVEPVRDLARIRALPLVSRE